MTTAPCEEVSSWRAIELSSGKPMTTPPTTISSWRSCTGLGRGSSDPPQVRRGEHTRDDGSAERHEIRVEVGDGDLGRGEGEGEEQHSQGAEREPGTGCPRAGPRQRAQGRRSRRAAPL